MAAVSFLDRATGQLVSGQARRAEGVHLLVEVFGSTSDDPGCPPLATRGMRMITASDAEDEEAFWRAWRQCGGEQLYDADGRPFR